jgi:hypothetical protein
MMVILFFRVFSTLAFTSQGHQQEGEKMIIPKKSLLVNTLVAQRNITAVLNYLDT